MPTESNQPATDSKARFSNRVDDYIRYRPGYPPEVLEILRREAGLTSDFTIADIGSGTGISTEMFLRNGNTVFGVEPNEAMRSAAERLLSGYPKFRSVAAPAEATTLADGSIDMLTAAQAFHWFDRARTRPEFVRILRPRGLLVILWNTRLVDTTPLLRGYEALSIEFATDYQTIDHRNVDDKIIAAFYAPSRCEKRTVPNHQVFDYAGLQGRLLSSSYAPPLGHPRHEPMLAALRNLFEEHAVPDAAGRRTVRFDYDTEIFFGPLA
ncbi:MAG: methyltransferase domain-containing protein [Planctomycetia bacterium]|nr:methyltransferase domain-containing protein [Planctomycetia bacterium]